MFQKPDQPACCCTISETTADTMFDMGTKVGRPSKGERHVIVTRPQRPVADAVMKQAAACGLSISEYVAGILADTHGFPQYAPVPQEPYDQQELPLKTA